MNLYKVYIRNAGQLDIIYVHAKNTISVPTAMISRYERGVIVKIVQMYSYNHTRMTMEKNVNDN